MLKKAADLFFSHFQRVSLVVEKDEMTRPVHVRLLRSPRIMFGADGGADLIEAVRGSGCICDFKRLGFTARFAVHEPSLDCQAVLRNDNSQISQRFRSFERKSDLLANTRDNRRNCRLIHMLDGSPLRYW